MLNVAAFLYRDKTPQAGESRSALPFPDPWVLMAALLLLALGLLMVTSASMPIAHRETGQPFYFLIRQGAFVLIGLFAAGAVFQIPLARWQQASPLLLMVAIGLLVLVLIPGIGKEVNGSLRWIRIGPINIQVSEIAKLFTLIYIADYLKRHGAELQTADFRVSALALLRPMAVLAVLAVLLLLEPDFGSVVVLMAAAMGMVFLAGVNLWQFGTLMMGTSAVMAVLLWSSPYRRARLISFLNPWDDPFASGFQLTQSLIAIGRGELFGVGLGESVQKLFYLPEAYTDFLFAVLAEELGLVGILTIIALFITLVWRAFHIGQRAERLGKTFSAWLAYGVGLWLGIQSLFNMGVNMGVLPTKGLTLPLMSYGGSSVVVMCMALALLLRVDVETRANKVRKE
ncbi:MAG TPA: putative lipid II flippase FtsW [Candidatus Competibacteraceae bacterium]|nr:putative lipid II flippase FtsW [Candidatus Competibacteraceae bacterium]MCP5135027.1 putative lipid II flippase FtsW [Gammaproteobacteria bacterium]HPF57468.1 putative lipid II flippase FtsW [Candidatus Competibacteraceae bacterium]HRY17174.1 putative lipid II flippase FtsW [Candidatus Competibacteraceae bacterium]